MKYEFWKTSNLYCITLFCKKFKQYFRNFSLFFLKKKFETFDISKNETNYLRIKLVKIQIN